MNDDISKICLRGRPVPPSLARIWAAYEAGDDFLGKAIELTLLTSLQPLDAGYGDAIAWESADIAANVRAHRAVFERLGFFAEDGDGGFLAFDLTAALAEDPPVIHLDSEGQYEWLGANLGEALMRRAEDCGCEAAMAHWLSAHGVEAALLGAFGASTQFLPSLRDLHSGLYYAHRGEPHAMPASATTPANTDPATWFLRPGAEVAAALTTLLGGPPDQQWVQCDGQGRVNAIWFHRVPATEHVRIQGIGFGDDARSVEERLGAPHDRGKSWARWTLGPAIFRIGFEGGLVAEIGLFSPR